MKKCSYVRLQVLKFNTMAFSVRAYKIIETKRNATYSKFGSLKRICLGLLWTEIIKIFRLLQGSISTEKNGIITRKPSFFVLHVGRVIRLEGSKLLLCNAGWWTNPMFAWICFDVTNVVFTYIRSFKGSIMKKRCLRVQNSPYIMRQ